MKQLACSSWFHLSLEHFEVIWDDSNTREKLKTKAIQFNSLLSGERGWDKVFYGRCTSGECNVETQEQLRTRAL